MERIEDIISTFDQRIQRAHEQIDEINQKITDVDIRLRERVEQFSSDIGKLHLDGRNDFEKELMEVIRQYQAGCQEWCKKIDTMIKGKTFIDQFEKSILVVVFGNVNVGKSSVGNLIAGTADPESNRESYGDDRKVLLKFFGEPPEFYEYDLADGSREQGARKKEEDYFKEGYVETTANIQYFTRHGGLTWTDSPGIASVNRENGDLAKKYVEFADLVIFITTSSSPAKNDEVQELRKLFGKKKPLLILINKSDKIDKDEVDGKIVKRLIPKSSEDRQKQEAYVKQDFVQAASELVSEVDAISISTYLAIDAMRKEDAELFVQSGYPKFYERLGKLFEQHAVDLKMNAPRQRVNAVIDAIIEGEANGGSGNGEQMVGIHQYIARFGSEAQKTEQADVAVGEMADKAVSEIVNNCMNEISALIQEQAHQVRTGGNGSDLRDKIDRVITRQTADVLEREFREILKDYSDGMVKQEDYQGKGKVNVEAKQDKVERYAYETKTVRRDPKGLIEHAQHWLFKKEFTEDKVKKRLITEWYNNGDNSSKVQEQIRQELDKEAQKYVAEFAENVREHYFGQEQKIIDTIIKMLEKLEADIEKEKLGNG